jgi:predicted SprT family Zn-dependent metalloprotease
MSNTRETILENLFGELNSQMFERRLSMVSVEFSERMTSAAGRYFPQRKLIRLSAPYLRLHGWDKCRDTLIHEMIHADLHVRGKPYGHTPEFKHWLKKLTGEKSIYHHDDMRPYDRPYRHVYTCPRGHKYYRKNRTRRKTSCGQCDKTYNPRYLLKYIGRENV